jgi:hypothetical protein
MTRKVVSVFITFSCAANQQKGDMKIKIKYVSIIYSKFYYYYSYFSGKYIQQQSLIADYNLQHFN